MASVCEKKQGYPKGGSNTKMPEISTEPDCKAKCDVSMQCWGWAFQTGTTNCWHYSTAYGFTANSAYAGGSCYGKYQVFSHNLIFLSTFSIQSTIYRYTIYNKIPTTIT